MKEAWNTLHSLEAELWRFDLETNGAYKYKVPTALLFRVGRGGFFLAVGRQEDPTRDHNSSDVRYSCDRGVGRAY